MNRIKRQLSIFLAALILTLAIPVGDFVSYAENTGPEVREVIVKTIYDDITSPPKYTIDIYGENFTDENDDLRLNIGFSEKGGSNKVFRDPDLFSNKTMHFNSIKVDEITPYIDIDGELVEISGNLPTLKTKEPSSGAIKSEEGKIVLTGTNFEEINKPGDDNNGEILAGVEQAAEPRWFKHGKSHEPGGEVDKVGEDEAGAGVGRIESSILKGKLGKFHIVFQRTNKRKWGNKKIDVTTRTRYRNTFRVYQELDIGKPVTVHPTRGELETKVKLQSPRLLETDKMSVFMVKDLNEPLTFNHMSKYEHFIDKNDEGNETFIFEVPKTLRDQYDNHLGDYHIVLTNNVDPEGEEPEEQIDSRTELKQKFTVVDGEVSMKLDSIYPKSGSVDGGEPLQVRGRYISRMAGTVNQDAGNPEIRRGGEDGESKNSIIAEYKNGIYGDAGGINGIRYETLKREIKVQIGREGIFTSFEEDEDDGEFIKITGGTNETLYVTTPEITLGEDENPVKDVSVQVETKIEYYNFDKDDDGDFIDKSKKKVIWTDKGWKRKEPSEGKEISFPELKTITLREEDTLREAFTYIPNGYIPEITGVFPEIIPVDKKGKVDPEGIKLIITGKDFTLHRYTDKNNKTRFKYPVIDLAGDGVVGGGDISINKNLDDEISMEIFNAEGENLTGRLDDNLGTRIEVILPNDSKIDPSKIGIEQDIIVTNPLLNDKKIEKVTEDKDNDEDEKEKESYISNMALPSRPFSIKFIEKDVNDIRIRELIPNVVKTTGYEGAIITGQHFLPETKIYIDGEEINGAEIDDIGEQLTFDLPPKPEGEYQILLQKENGSIAITTVEYIESSTKLRFEDFNPKKGTAGTVVTVTGGGFLRPANTKIVDISTAAIAKRLIGTTVYLGDKDVNEYNTDNDGKIKLEPFLMNDNLLQKNSDDKTKLTKDSHGLILVEDLEDDGESYFSIYQDIITGEFKLSDTVDDYILKLEEGEIKASLRGEEYTVDSTEEYTEEEKTGTKIILQKDEIKKEFKVKTPYKVSGGKITGNRVKVINQNELTFEVPARPREGYYDVKLENPDTNNVSRVGEEGFYYSYHPDYNPEIEKIDPNEGSVDGGYTIEITAKGSDSSQFKGFIDNGVDDRVSVTIGTETVPAEDIKVSSDGYSMTVVVPRYPGDLASETEMDGKSVNVVVVNPDGGSDSMENGFTYVIPKSRPRLTNLFRREGGASGGEIVVVEGSQFRYFEPFEDKNNNAQWDKGEPIQDLNKNDKWDDLRKKEVHINGEAVSIYDLKNNDGPTTEYWESDQWEEFVKPILPRINFVVNGEKKEATIIEFDVGRIEVIAPEGINGPAEVYLVNNDNGVSNKLTYDYRVTNPSINVITPDTASRKGGQDVQILGENFVESNINIIQSQNNATKRSMQLVQFGGLEDVNTSNQRYNLGDLDNTGFENSGRVSNRQAEVRVNDLTVIYDATNPGNKKLKFEIKKGTGDNEKIYDFEYHGWDEEDIYLPLDLLKSAELNEDGEREKYEIKEMIKVSLEDLEGAQHSRRLRVDRGFSPEAELENSRDISVQVPTYYTVGETIARVINSDKQEATAAFNYSNPLSDPKITRILRNNELGVEDGGLRIVEVPYTGGSRITVEGVDFYRGARLEIGGDRVNQDLLEFYPEMQNKADYIMFTIEGVDESRVGENHRVSLVNPDGGSTITTDIRIRFIKPETANLSINSVVPNTGPTKGGTEVTIHGNDFRGEMDGHTGKLKVFFEKGNQTIQVPQLDIISVDLHSIVLRTPAFTAGPANIIVENPDGNSVRLLDGFTYTSNPRITSVVDPEDDKLVIENISVEGGERVKIKGSDFIEGATVIFNPELEAIGDDVRDENLPEGEIITINEKRYVLKSGVEGTDVEIVNGQNILVTTPEGKLGDKGVLVRNPDGGVSNVYNIEYGIPEVGAPFNVRAELVYDEFIRVTWDGVRNALEYEIYVSEDGKSFEYVDSTELTSYAYQDILPRTKYEFMVRAIGQYGSSEPLDESKSNIVRTGSKAGPEDLDGELGENTVVERQGTVADISIGSRDFGSTGYTIDLTRGNLAGVKDLTIRMPAEIVTSYASGDIRVLGTDYSMTFNPSVFRNNALESNRNNSNAGVVFKVTPYNGSAGNAGGRTVAGPRYELQGETYIGKNRTKVGRLAGGISMNMDTNTLLIQSRNLRNMGLSRYYEGNNSWINTQSVDRMAIYTMTGSRR